MTTTQFKYPALYATANQMSSGSQSTFLWLIRAEYGLLFISAVSSMNFYTTPVYFIVPALALIVSLVVMMIRSLLKPEQGWYRGRALAESIKTSSWKYCMRGEPFGDAYNLAVRRAEFRTYLTEILSANRLLGDRMPPDQAAADQITQSMEDVRALRLEDRIQYYDTYRISEQRQWYADKAAANRRASRLWVGASVIAYALAIFLSLVRLTAPAFEFLPIEPIIVIASSILGWMQVKKFNELASSYTLTAHEIGIIRGKLGEVKAEVDFSQFVVESEQAFSREHTQWVARQQHA
jgi:hypothetical protein